MMPWPNRELQSARPLRRSPLYDRLAAQNALFGSKMGWERPNFFAPQRGRARASTIPAGGRTGFRTRGRAQGDARGRDDHRPDLVREVPGAGPRRRARAAAALRQRRRRAGRHNGLHRAAQRARHLRERPDGRAARRRTASCSSPAPRRRRATPTGSGATSADGRARDAHRRDLGLCGDRRDGAARARAPGAGHQAPLDNAAFPFGAIREIDIGYATLLRLAPHLCRRARLGALRAGRICRRRSTTR